MEQQKILNVTKLNKMKKILTIIKLLIVLNTVNLYSQVSDISKLGADAISGVHYKDNLNLMNQFEGKYKYENGSTSIEIELIKKTDMPIFNTGAFQDIVIGEIKYIENGILKLNTLPNLNQNIPFSKHVICGFVLLNNNNDYPCTTCYSGQKRLMATFTNPLNDKVDIDLYFKKVTLPNGTITMEMMMKDRTKKTNIVTGPIFWGTHLFPVQTYILTKI